MAAWIVPPAAPAPLHSVWSSNSSKKQRHHNPAAEQLQCSTTLQMDHPAIRELQMIRSSRLSYADIDFGFPNTESMNAFEGHPIMSSWLGALSGRLHRAAVTVKKRSQYLRKNGCKRKGAGSYTPKLKNLHSHQYPNELHPSPFVDDPREFSLLLLLGSFQRCHCMPQSTLMLKQIHTPLMQRF